MFFDFARIVEISVTVMGLLYLWWEFHANAKMWIMGIIMPAIDIYLYWNKGVYGNMAMSTYYLLVAVYGALYWRLRGNKASTTTERPITHIGWSTTILFLLLVIAVWVVTYYLLINYTPSTVPALDALTNALSIVGMIALARKYVEQWFFWIIYDLATVYLDAIKDLPFKAGIHLLYAAVALAGYIQWRKKMQTDKLTTII